MRVRARWVGGVGSSVFGTAGCKEGGFCSDSHPRLRALVFFEAETGSEKYGVVELETRILM